MSPPFFRDKGPLEQIVGGGLREGGGAHFPSKCVIHRYVCALIEERQRFRVNPLFSRKQMAPVGQDKALPE